MADVRVLVYLNDILILSKGEQNYKQHVHAVFKQLGQQDFHVKRQKCTLFTNSIEFLGYAVSARSIEVCSNKIGLIWDQLIPTSVRDIQSFLGLCSYLRHFISKFAHVAQPLTDLICKQIEFNWILEYQYAFHILTIQLLIAPVLTIFNPEAHSEVQCEANNFAVGDVLMQQDMLDGPWKPVEYLSKRLNATE